MGGCLCGNINSVADNSQNTKKSVKQSSLNWTKETKLKLEKGASFGAPFINNQRISFLTSFDESLSVISYDLKTNDWLENASVNCDAESFDISNCVYSFHAKTNTLYFIRDNAQLFSLDLATNTLKSIAAVSSSEGTQVLIHSQKGKVYILGNEEEHKSNDDFVYVSYDEEMKGRIVQEIGNQSVTESVTLKGKDYIYIIGGITKFKYKNDLRIPNDIYEGPHRGLWILDIAERSWQRRWTGLEVAICGIVNYDNAYLFVFGGLMLNQHENAIKESKSIFALQFDTGEWFMLRAKLPDKGRYFAVYPQGSNAVRLFSWNGMHLTAQIHDIVHYAKKEELRFKIGEWNESSGIVYPSFKYSEFYSNTPCID
eukprot:1205_1